MKNKLFLASLAAAIAVPVMVAPVQAEVKEFKGFSDVPKTHAYYDTIMEMQAEGIINGYEDNTFRPKQAISRMHVASLLDRAIALEPIREAIDFADVPKTHAYHGIIEKLYRAGIVDGDKGNFNPSASLTRVQMAKILVNAFDLKVKAEYDFPDVPKDHWGNEYVRALYSNGITTGDNGYFNPNEPVSREHYAVFLHRLLNIDEDFVAPPIPEPKPDPKPEPEKPTNPGNNVIPSEKDVVKPAGWTPAQLEVNKQQAFEAAPNRPNKYDHSFGIAKIPLDEYREAISSKYLEKFLVNIKSSDTLEDLIIGLNYAIETGKAYTASDKSYTIYVEYLNHDDPHTPLAIVHVAA